MRLRDWITLGASLVLIITAFVLGMRCSVKPNTHITITDTIRLTAIVRDTLLRWHERVVWKEVKPETVYVHPDTVMPETLWGRWPEAIVSLDYTKGRLDFTSLLPTNLESGKALARQYHYDVGQSFEIRSKGEGFHVRTRRNRPTFNVGVGSELRLWGDSTSVIVVPFAEVSVGWHGLHLGPRLDTRGLHVVLGYRKSF
ncbi:hypothetical protein GF359_02155 [candidate division WOR-3 bacterium]|uniref:Uncharacterized protein n=1 Tax=candidate division WOR-3 bacterium TaxID=2052148 RepID=A0A9D5K9Z3_UNCW3|nr:hypothetical protein [candidate division WOR-3 bacterium]MBD3363996.1 hypothetical protein [candidate division WOR-3 bacterium]